MAHWVKVLAGKPDDVGSNPQTLWIGAKVGCIAHISNTSCSSGEVGVETGGSPDASEPAYPLHCGQETLSRQGGEARENLN